MTPTDVERLATLIETANWQGSDLPLISKTLRATARLVRSTQIDELRGALQDLQAIKPPWKGERTL